MILPRWCSGVFWGSAYECVQPSLLARAQSQSFAAVEEGTQDMLGAPSVLWLVSAWCCPATSLPVKPWRLLLCLSLCWAYHPGKGTSQCVMIIMWSCNDCCLFIFSSVLYLCCAACGSFVHNLHHHFFFYLCVAVCCVLIYRFCIHLQHQMPKKIPIQKWNNWQMGQSSR